MDGDPDAMGARAGGPSLHRGAGGPDMRWPRCLAPLLTLVLVSLRGQLAPDHRRARLPGCGDRGRAGRRPVPAVLEAVGGSLLVGFYFTPQRHTVTIAGANNAAVLGVFVAVALAVSLLARDAARRTSQAARATAECELLARAAASVVAGPQALTAVLDQAREASGMESVTLLERGPGVRNATGGAQPAGRPSPSPAGRR